MDYFGLYYKKNNSTELAQIQKADLYFNANLKKLEDDDYSWNTTLAKKVNLPDSFWILVQNAEEIRFDFIKAFQGFLVSANLLEIFQKYTSNIQYTRAYIVDKKNKEAIKKYYYVRFTSEIDVIDLKNSIYEKEYDSILDEEEIIRYKKLVLQVPAEVDILITKDEFSNWLHQVFVSDRVKQQIELENLNSLIDLIPVSEVANFHNKYYSL